MTTSHSAVPVRAGPLRRGDPRRPALIAFAFLGAALLVTLAVTTPWDTLPAPPGGAVAADPARDFAAADIAREDRYHRQLWPAVLGATALSLLVALLLGFTGTGARIVRAAARPLGGGRLARFVAGALAVTALPVLAVLPLGIWRENLQRDYGLVVRDWGDYAMDVARSYGIAAGATLIGLGVLYLLMRRFPRRWWAPGAVLGAVLVIGGSYLYPVVVEPAFNDFASLPEGELRSSLLGLAARDGIEVGDVLVADESKRSTRINAYVSGIGSSRRIVLYDTTIRELPPDEIRQIIAHELAHVQRRDVLNGTLIGALGAGAGVCLLYLALSSRRLLRRAGVDEPSDPASLALVLALVAGITAVCLPVVGLVSRKVEARADIDSLELTRDPATLIDMQRRLSTTNLSDLDAPPIVIGLRATHPNAPTRIANARTWAQLNGVPVPPDQAGVPIEPR